MTQPRLKPELGRFYRSRADEIWCCFRARPLVKPRIEWADGTIREGATYTQSYCVRLSDGHLNYFLDDHSFDLGGEIEDELVEVVSEQVVQSLPWRPLPQ